MKIKLFMVVILMVGLSACDKKPVANNTNDMKFSKNFGVTLLAKPRRHKPTVEIKTKAQGWGKDDKGGRKNGYVGYQQGEFGTTFFIIRNEDVGDSCSGKADWVITELLVSATGDPDTEKGTNFGDSQEAYPWLAEAFPGIDLTDGSLFTTENKNEGVIFLPVYNANGQLGEKFIYYEVTLSECDGDKVLTTDPGWKNGGRD